MAQGSTEGPWGKYITSVVLLALGTPLTVLFKLAGSELSVGTATSLAVIWLAFLLVFLFFGRHYEATLAGSTQTTDSAAYQSYQALRQSLEAGGRAAEIYANQLVALLTRIDAFFGDRPSVQDFMRPPEPSPSLRKLGFQRAYPLWTAPSYDRCLMLALAYPLAVIYFGWVISSEVGPAEQALGLLHLPLWQRLVVASGLGLMLWGFRHVRSLFRSIRALVPTIAGLGGAFVALAFSGNAGRALAAGVIGGVAIITALTRMETKSKVEAGAFAVIVSFGATFAVSVATHALTVGTGAVMLGVFVATAFIVGIVFELGIHKGLCYAGFTALGLGYCYFGSNWLAASPAWQQNVGAALLFLPLLTLLNAPFDWFSLGLTRTLLRLGLEKQGWWPYAFAVIDVLIAIPMVLLLSCLLAVGIQGFDFVALHHGASAAILPLDAVFDDLQNNPWQWHLSWLYALLLTTILPSLINCTIACFAFFRALPWSTRYLLKHMPEHGKVRAPNQLAIILAAQWAFGFVLGLGALALLLWGLVLHVLPAVGIELLAIVRSAVALNIPQQIANWLS